MSDQMKPKSVDEFFATIDDIKEGEPFVVRIGSPEEFKTFMEKAEAGRYEVKLEATEWMHWRGDLPQPRGDDGSLVADREELRSTKVCCSCHSLSSKDTFRLIKKGWQPVIMDRLNWHQGEAEGLRVLTRNIVKLKQITEYLASETASDSGITDTVGLLVEPETGAHPFVICRGHFDDDEWEKLLDIERWSEIGRTDVNGLQS